MRAHLAMVIVLWTLVTVFSSVLVGSWLAAQNRRAESSDSDERVAAGRF